MKTELPKTVTAKLYVLATPYGGAILCSSDMSEHGYACLAEHEMTFDVPQEDPTPKFIEALEAKAEDIQAEATMQVNAIKDQIQKMRCIEHKPESGDE